MLSSTQIERGQDTVCVTPPVQPASAEIERRPAGSLAPLLSAARAGDRESIGQLLQIYRRYLTLLAVTQLDPRIQPRAMAGIGCDYGQSRRHNDIFVQLPDRSLQSKKPRGVMV